MELRLMKFLRGNAKTFDQVFASHLQAPTPRHLSNSYSPLSDSHSHLAIAITIYYLLRLTTTILSKSSFSTFRLSLSLSPCHRHLHILHHLVLVMTTIFSDRPPPYSPSPRSSSNLQSVQSTSLFINVKVRVFC